MTVSRQLRIGQFISHYPYAQQTAGYFTGGTGEVARGLSRALATLGHDVHIVAVAADKRSSVSREEGVTIHRSGSRLRVAQANLSTSILWEPFRERFDLVHIHAGNPPSPLVGYLYAMHRRVPLVITYHGDPQASYGSVTRRAGVMAWGWALRRLLKSADRIVCPSGPFVPSSRYLRSYVERIDEVPNGIEPDTSAFDETPEEARTRLGLPPTAPVILFLGALSPYKAPDLVVAAADRVLRRHPNAWLLIAGSGTMEDSLRRAAAASDIGDRIKFLGFVTGEMKRRAYRAASIFVLPSVMTTEVFPLVLIEASTFGLPLVVSDLPTFHAIITPGNNGLIVRRGEVVQLADALGHLISDAETRVRMGQCAQERMKDYTWAHIATRYEAIYRSVLDQSDQVRSAS